MFSDANKQSNGNVCFAFCKKPIATLQIRETINLPVKAGEVYVPPLGIATLLARRW